MRDSLADIFGDDENDDFVPSVPELLKCLYCNVLFDALRVTIVYQNGASCGRGRPICKNGHLIGVCRDANRFWTEHIEWIEGVPGSLVKFQLFNFISKQWTTHYCKDQRFFSQYKHQQLQWRIERRESRFAWLQCALRMGICPDVRKLIATYVNREPIVFWSK